MNNYNIANDSVSGLITKLFFYIAKAKSLAPRIEVLSGEEELDKIAIEKYRSYRKEVNKLFGELKFKNKHIFRYTLRGTVDKARDIIKTLPKI